MFSLYQLILITLFIYSRLVRQDHVKDEGEKRSPIIKTFAEAKQNLIENFVISSYDQQQDAMYEQQHNYNNEYKELSSTFAEADENNYTEDNYDQYSSVVQTVDLSSGTHYKIEQTTQYHDHETRRYDGNVNQQPKNKSVKSVESFLHEQSQESYFTPDEYIKNAQKNRNRRRKSRELPIEPEVIVSKTNEEVKAKPKPEAMRSVSEDSSPKIAKIVPRRSMSHPEKETLPIKMELTPIPSPKPLSEMTDRLRKAFRPSSPRRISGNDDQEVPEKVEVDAAVQEPKKPVWKFQKMLEQRGDSKSFDAVVRHIIKTDKEVDVSQSMDDNLFSDTKEVKLLNN